jgi:hypothetical protein
MSVNLEFQKGQSTRKDLCDFSYKIYCEGCNRKLYKTKHALEYCAFCGEKTPSRARYLPGFQPARLKYYNEIFFKGGKLNGK